MEILKTGKSRQKRRVEEDIAMKKGEVKAESEGNGVGVGTVKTESVNVEAGVLAAVAGKDAPVEKLMTDDEDQDLGESLLILCSDISCPLTYCIFPFCSL